MPVRPKATTRARSSRHSCRPTVGQAAGPFPAAPSARSGWRRARASWRGPASGPARRAAGPHSSTVHVKRVAGAWRAPVERAAERNRPVAGIRSPTCVRVVLHAGPGGFELAAEEAPHLGRLARRAGAPEQVRLDAHEARLPARVAARIADEGEHLLRRPRDLDRVGVGAIARPPSPADDPCSLARARRGPPWRAPDTKQMQRVVGPALELERSRRPRPRRLRSPPCETRPTCSSKWRLALLGLEEAAAPARSCATRPVG